MHELPVTEQILKIVLKHAQLNGVARVSAIGLQIGRLSDLEDEWIQRYFDYLSKGTAAEGAKLKIERMPVVIRCGDCQTNYNIETAQISDLTCPLCGGKNGELVSGREYRIKDMEVQ